MPLLTLHVLLLLATCPLVAGTPASFPASVREPSSCPSPREQFSLACMPEGQAYLFGGRSSDAKGSSVLTASSEYWLFNRQDARWKLIEPGPDSRGFGKPVARYGHASAVFGYSTMGFTYIFGGAASNGTYLQDVWKIHSEVNNIENWTRVDTQWNESVHRPVARAFSGVATINNDARLFVFGGRLQLDSSLVHVYTTNELLVLDTSLDIPTFSVAFRYNRTCSSTNPPTCPVPRHSSGATLGAHDSLVFFFGGKNERGPLFNDVWAWDSIGSGGWNLFHPGGIDSQLPAPRYGHAIAGIFSARTGSNPATSKLFVFGGFAIDTTDNSEISLSDLWVFDVTNKGWSPVKTTPSSSAPSARGYAGAFFKLGTPPNAPFIVYGGANLKNGVFNDMFQINPSNTASASSQWQIVSQPSCTVDPKPPSPFPPSPSPDPSPPSPRIPGNITNGTNTSVIPSNSMSAAAAMAVVVLVLILGFGLAAGWVHWRKVKAGRSNEQGAFVRLGKKSSSSSFSPGDSSQDKSYGAIAPHPSSWD